VQSGASSNAGGRYRDPHDLHSELPTERRAAAGQIEVFGCETAMKRPVHAAELVPIYVLQALWESSYVTGEVSGVTGGNSIS
jgi:hypothetical protein